jgi:hypothetical protein
VCVNRVVLEVLMVPSGAGGPGARVLVLPKVLVLEVRVVLQHPQHD